jgi:hypothetical protein
MVHNVAAARAALDALKATVMAAAHFSAAMLRASLHNVSVSSRSGGRDKTAIKIE